jgi:hypothetical protein
MVTEISASFDDTITRYLYSRQNFGSHGVKANAFIDTRNPSELSVCVITGLSEFEIWDIASVIRTDKAVKARADLCVSDIQDISIKQKSFLQVLIDGVPHPRHANIKFPPLQESVRRAIAADLADRSGVPVLAVGMD